MSQLQTALKSGLVTVDELKQRVGSRRRTEFEVKLRVTIWGPEGEVVRPNVVSRLVAQTIDRHPKVASVDILTTRKIAYREL